MEDLLESLDNNNNPCEPAQKIITSLEQVNIGDALKKFSAQLVGRSFQELWTLYTQGKKEIARSCKEAFI